MSTQFQKAIMKRRSRSTAESKSPSKSAKNDGLMDDADGAGSKSEKKRDKKTKAKVEEDKTTLIPHNPSKLRFRRTPSFLMELWTSNFVECWLGDFAKIIVGTPIWHLYKPPQCPPVTNTLHVTASESEEAVNSEVSPNTTAENGSNPSTEGDHTVESSAENAVVNSKSIPNGKPRVTALCQQLARSDIDPHLLIEPHHYGVEGDAGEGRAQPFAIVAHPQVWLVTDVHSHLCDAEVIGLLAGWYDKTTQCLYVQNAFPCTSTERPDDDGSTDVELDPNCELQVRETIARLGLQVVGWYHSHPKFRPDPSVTDIFNQAQYQRLMRDEETGVEPFVGLIVSSYDSALPTFQALHQWFHVVPFMFETSRTKKEVFVPLCLAISVVSLAKDRGNNAAISDEENNGAVAAVENTGDFQSLVDALMSVVPAPKSKSALGPGMSSSSSSTSPRQLMRSLSDIQASTRKSLPHETCDPESCPPGISMLDGDVVVCPPAKRKISRQQRQQRGTRKQDEVEDSTAPSSDTDRNSEEGSSSTESGGQQEKRRKKRSKIDETEKDGDDDDNSSTPSSLASSDDEDEVNEEEDSELSPASRNGNVENDDAKEESEEEESADEDDLRSIEVDVVMGIDNDEDEDEGVMDELDDEEIDTNATVDPPTAFAPMHFAGKGGPRVLTADGKILAGDNDDEENGDANDDDNQDGSVPEGVDEAMMDVVTMSDVDVDIDTNGGYGSIMGLYHTQQPLQEQQSDSNNSENAVQQPSPVNADLVQVAETEGTEATHTISGMDVEGQFPLDQSTACAPPTHTQQPDEISELTQSTNTTSSHSLELSEDLEGMMTKDDLHSQQLPAASTSEVDSKCIGSQEVNGSALVGSAEEETSKVDGAEANNSVDAPASVTVGAVSSIEPKLPTHRASSRKAAPRELYSDTLYVKSKRTTRKDTDEVESIESEEKSSPQKKKPGRNNNAPTTRSSAAAVSRRSSHAEKHPVTKAVAVDEEVPIKSSSRLKGKTPRTYAGSFEDEDIAPNPSPNPNPNPKRSGNRRGSSSAAEKEKDADYVEEPVNKSEKRKRTSTSKQSDGNDSDYSDSSEKEKKKAKPKRGRHKSNKTVENDENGGTSDEILSPLQRPKKSEQAEKRAVVPPPPPAATTAAANGNGRSKSRKPAAPSKFDPAAKPEIRTERASGRGNTNTSNSSADDKNTEKSQNTRKRTASAKIKEEATVANGRSMRSTRSNPGDATADAPSQGPAESKDETDKSKGERSRTRRKRKDEEDKSTADKGKSTTSKSSSAKGSKNSKSKPKKSTVNPNDFLPNECYSLVQLLQSDTPACQQARQLVCEAPRPSLRAPLLLVSLLLLHYSAHARRVDFEKKFKEVTRRVKCASSAGGCLSYFGVTEEEAATWVEQFGNLLQTCWSESARESRRKLTKAEMMTAAAAVAGYQQEQVVEYVRQQGGVVQQDNPADVVNHAVHIAIV